MFDRYANPQYLYLLLIIPVLLGLYVVVRFLYNRSIKRFGDWNVIKQLMPDVSLIRQSIKFIVLCIALGMLIWAIARPQSGSKLQQVKRSGIELIIALDVSNSMLATDIKPNRLENAKRTIEKILSKLDEDKVALIVFAGDAYVQIPMTTDFSAAKLFLATANPGIVPKQGTAIGSAIDLAIKSFSPEGDVGKVLVIITDGENHEDNPLEAAKRAAEKGIVIHTIGLGSPEGAPLPKSEGIQDFKKDNGGSVIISKLDEATLTQIAAATNGIYIRANNSKSALNALFDEVDKMDKKEMEAKIYADFDDKFPILITIALIFVLLDFIILERKNRLFKNVNIFKLKI